MSRLSKKLFYTIGITFLCCSLQAQSLDQAKKNYTTKGNTRKPNLPLKSWSNKRQAIPPIIIGMVCVVTKLEIWPVPRNI